METCEKLAVRLVDIRRIRLAYLMFCLPRNARMRLKGKTVNIAIHLLDRKIRQSLTLLTFGNSLLKMVRPTPKPIYNIQNPNGLKLLTILRLGLSHLNEHKFNDNFKDCVNLLCSCCLEVESVPHFFLHCYYFTDIRKTLFHEL